MSAPGVSLSVSEWTLETVRRVVAEHPHEPDWFDYKEALVPHRSLSPGKKAEHKESIRRCGCAMSNSEGGFIVFGVKDKGNPADRLVGIDLKQDVRRLFGDLLGAIDPNIRDFDAIAIPLDPGKPDGNGLWVVQMPTSPLRPHMLDGRFYKRTSAGKCEHMSAHEVRDQMLFREEQLKRLELLRFAFEQMEGAHQDMLHSPRVAQHIAARFDTGSFRLLVGEVAHLMKSKLLKELLDLCTIGDCLNRRYDWAREEYNAHRVLNRPYEPETSNMFAELRDIKKRLGDCMGELEEFVTPLLGGG